MFNASSLNNHERLFPKVMTKICLFVTTRCIRYVTFRTNSLPVEIGKFKSRCREASARLKRRAHRADTRVNLVTHVSRIWTLLVGHLLFEKKKKKLIKKYKRVQ